MILILLFSKNTFAQNPYTADLIYREEQYLSELRNVDSLNFIYSFEYPFLLYLEEEEKQNYLAIRPLEQKKKYIEDYWIRVNPNPLLPRNDRLMDYLRRYAYVREHFSRSEPPYFDDRGMYHIKYGQPMARHQDRGGVVDVILFRDQKTHQYIASRSRKGVGTPREYEVHPNETWTYENLHPNFVVFFVKDGEQYKEVRDIAKIIRWPKIKNSVWVWSDFIKRRAWMSTFFMDVMSEAALFEDAIGIYLVDPYDRGLLGSSEQGIYDKSSERPIVKIKEHFEKEEKIAKNTAPTMLYEPDKAVNDLRFYHEIAQFRTDNGMTGVEITMLSPLQDNIIDTIMTGTLDIEFTALMRDQSYHPVITDKTIQQVPAQVDISRKIPNAIGALALRASSQSGDLTMQVRDETNDRIGFIRKDFSIRDFSGDDLKISDIQFLTRIRDSSPQQSLPTFEREGIRVATYPFHQIRKRYPLMCYFEVYNLKSSGIVGEYELTITVSTRRERENTLKKFARWITRRKDNYLSMTQKEQITANTVKELIAVDMRNLSKGPYILEITVKDTEDKGIVAVSRKDIVIADN